ncbi:uncharacterized protein LOC135077921 [Ostrinia nubilalis]|uniref:uncharacterized protein LOC135077921 n=1 Tax=Ostrinia nubilalis TaxID=29057 RepID=UPI0030824271
MGNKKTIPAPDNTTPASTPPENTDPKSSAPANTAPESTQQHSLLKSRRRKVKRRLKFARALNILVIDPREYCWTVWYAVGLGLVHVSIGAVNMVALAYSGHTGDSHAILCTVGYHFFTAEAILSMNYANGWSLPLKPRHRRCAHIFLQVCGVTCAVAGTALVLISRGYVKGQPHGITGLITLTLAGLSVIFGPFNFLSRQNRFSPFFKIVHMGVGMPTFFMSSISLCLGFLTSEFKSWAASVVVYVLTAFVVFYTAFILANVFIKCMSRI